MQTYNWYSVPKQVESVGKLLQYDFVHICPGTNPHSLLQNDTLAHFSARRMALCFV